MNPRDLRLESALALLDQAEARRLAETGASDTDFLQSVIDNLCELSLKDPLTGLANRRQFRSVLGREIDAVARLGEPALLLLLDIDHFKKFNDHHGHSAGDLVIQSIARCLTTCVRPMDTVARFGGEEFAVILPSCQYLYGQAVANRIRESVEALRIETAPGVVLQVTVSIGGAYAAEWVRCSPSAWTDRADLQLYRAKAEGRNRVCIDTQDAVAVSAEEKSLLFAHLELDLDLGAESTVWRDSVLRDGGSSQPHGTGS
ncbi:MAG: GGDEF domain-containing protein [Rhodoferax sp.]|nr:GGDEF domain-containing protein [Rhodoferax sp.]